MLVTEKFGHGRTAIMATGGSWRWQMSSPLGDTAYYLFWQQLVRWLISDTPGHVAASVPAQILLDNGSVNLTAEVRDQQYNPASDARVEAHIFGPSGVTAQLEMTPVPDNPGQFQAAWSAPKEGAYLTEVTAQRVDANTGKVQDLGRDVLTFQRMDGVAEQFHTEQNRELLERLANQTGGKYWKPADLGGLAKNIPYSESRRDHAPDQGSVGFADRLPGLGPAAIFRVVAKTEVGNCLRLRSTLPGAKVDIAVESGRLVVEPQQRRRYTLDELVAQCNSKARRTKQEREWLNSKAVGGELI